MTLRTLNYGNYGIFLGNAGFCPSAVVLLSSFKGLGVGRGGGVPVGTCGGLHDGRIVI